MNIDIHKVKAAVMEAIGKHDKAAHAIAGAVLFAAVRFMLNALPGTPEGRTVLALVAVAFVGWYKEERYDADRPESHTVDGWDAYATIVGGIAAAAVHQIALAMLARM